MNNTGLPFWEISYRQDDSEAFCASPNNTLTEFEHLLDSDARILEAGCGEGQNVLYLAQRGFADIDAFDISEAGIEKLRRRSEQAELKINAFSADLARFDFTRDYDLVMSFASLCFAERSGWRRFILNAKEHTRPDGIHIMHTFTDTVPASPDIAPFAVGLAKDGELKDLYADWEILQFLSYTFEDEHPGVPRHTHAANKIVARRK